MDQHWFEFRDIRRRRLEGAVWIPLRSSNTILSKGQKGYAGNVEEFYGAGSLAIDSESRADAVNLGWMDIGLIQNHRGFVGDEGYIQSDVYLKGEKPIGVNLVLDQHINREESRIWHLHQDIVISLSLVREGDRWLAANEGYIEVAKLHKREDGCPFLMEIRSEYLKDYLCARNMALLISSYRSRIEIVEDSSHIDWESTPEEDGDEHDRWEGRVSPIHEGGHPFGEKVHIFHVSRTDVDPEVDVPELEIPAGEGIESSKSIREFEGRRLYRIEGELWRDEWVEPGRISSRVRGDDTPETVHFLVDASGTTESKTSLAFGGRWLWFDPGVIMALAHRRGGNIQWYTRDTGSVRCSPDYDVHFGVNSLGLINAYAKDIVLLPDWQQRIWAGYNVGPEGKVSEELLASQAVAKPASTQAPEAYLGRGLEYLNNVVKALHGIDMVRHHSSQKELLDVCHRFRAIDDAGFFALAKDLARLTADSFDETAIQKVVSPPKGEKWRSLKSLEKLVALHTDAKHARQLVAPLVGIYELRHGDAHLPKSDIDDSLVLVGIDRSLPAVLQGYQMLYACVGVLWDLFYLFVDNIQPDNNNNRE